MDPELLRAACRGRGLTTLLQDMPEEASSYGDPADAHHQAIVVVKVDDDDQLHHQAVVAVKVDDDDDDHPPEHGAGGSRHRRSAASLLTGVTPDGDSALHIVAARGDPKSAEAIHGRASHLLYAGNTKNGDTPLHCAARAGDHAMVSCLVALARRDGGDDGAKALMETRNRRGETALHEAVRSGDRDLVDKLLKDHPRLARVPSDGTSPLYLAVFLLRHEIIKLLFDHDRDLSYSGPDGQNALHVAVLRSQGITKDLLDWKKELTEQLDHNGDTPLHIAASWKVTKLPAEIKSPVVPLLVQANPSSPYKPDKTGSFPIHIAAAVGGLNSISHLLQECPECVGLRDSQGRTFLHVAAKRNRREVVSYACRMPVAAPVLNMQDQDGNTALHLAVEAGDSKMFSSLVGNLQVMLNLPNHSRQTPRDIARSKCPTESVFWMACMQNPQKLIHHSLEFVGAKYGCHRRDHFKARHTPQRDVQNDFEKIQDSTQTLGISSVLIATVTFGAAFAPPGGYIQDDHPHGGTPTLAGRYCFDAFIISNVLAFLCAVVATISLMFSGIAMVDLQIRKKHFYTAVFFSSSSYSCLAAAFALGLYMVLTPVAYDTAIAILVLISLFPVIVSVDLLQTLKVSIQIRARLGTRIYVAVLYLLFALLRYELWPVPIIYGWTMFSAYYRH